MFYVLENLKTAGWLKGSNQNTVQKLGVLRQVAV